MSPDELLRELGDLATSLGPAVRPAGRHRRAAAFAHRDGPAAVRRGGLLAGPATRPMTSRVTSVDRGSPDNQERGERTRPSAPRALIAGPDGVFIEAAENA